MSYTKRFVSMKTDEKTFIKTFISRLTSADERITCITPMSEIDEQFSTGVGQPSFTIDIDGQCQITFRRTTAISANATSYSVTMPFNNSVISLNFTITPYAHTAEEVRTLKFAVAKNENVLCLYIGNYENNPCEISVVCIDDGFKAYAGAYSVNGSVRAIKRKFLTSDDNSVFKTDRLNYTYDPNNSTNVEVIKSKVFLTDNSSIRTAAVESIYDISAVPAETIVNIGGKTYFSIDEHTIMEV